jgi:hypothetical protein
VLARRATDETKASFKTTEFYAMVVLIAAILVAAAASDTLDDVRAWTLVTAVGAGYMLSRGLAKSGTKYTGGERPARRWGPDSRSRPRLAQRVHRTTREAPARCRAFVRGEGRAGYADLVSRACLTGSATAPDMGRA